MVFTCLEYADDSTLYIATNNGKVTAWDTRHNTCFMHWEADAVEIGQLTLTIHQIAHPFLQMCSSVVRGG